MRVFSAMAAGAALIAAGALPAAPPVNARGEARLAKAIEGRVAGKPVSCINTYDIRSSEIIDGTAIVYHTTGDRLYVNRPASGQQFLHRDDILVTRTSMPELCNVDIVQLLDSGSHFPTGSVNLDAFVPYTKVGRRD